MSIEDAVNAYIEQGRLFALSAGELDGPERRRICASESVRRLVAGPWDDDAHEMFGRRVAAYLVAFIESEHIVVRTGPPVDDDALVVQLHPSDVIEIRCCSAGPSLRVFGFIAAPDLFVALHWKYFHDLKKYKNPAWAAAIRQCNEEWSGLFPFIAPVTGGKFPDDYISGAVSATPR